jgi:tetratricopeptide (TPR) repeat protein
MERYDEIFREAGELHLKGEVHRALELYDRLLAFKPDHAPLLACAGTGFCQAQAYGMAIQLLTKAVKIDPTIWDAWHNLGIAHRTMGMIDEAMACYKRELDNPKITRKDMAAIYGNMSGCYVNEGAPDKVIELADMGLRYNPNSPQLKNHKALALLEQGNYVEGFNLYEARYELAEFTNRDYGKAPRWDGHPVGKLAIHGEQGIGDEILFLTQLPQVLPFVDQVAVECTPRLLGLLRHSYKDEPKIRFFPDHGVLIKAFTADAWLGLGSLMLHAWPPIRSVYLKPSRTYFRGERPRLGITWRGGTLRTHEYHRNAPLELWKPFVDRIKSFGIDVISVQYGPAAEMAKNLGIPHDEANIADLDTLSAMIKSCDHIFSVCNTTIHQAGALGVPCTVIVPSKPAWRYGLTGDKSFWYESVEYIRQAMDESWDAAMARATAHMENWARHADHRALQKVERATA